MDDSGQGQPEKDDRFARSKAGIIEMGFSVEIQDILSWVTSASGESFVIKLRETLHSRQIYIDELIKEKGLLNG